MKYLLLLEQKIVCFFLAPSFKNCAHMVSLNPVKSSKSTDTHVMSQHRDSEGPHEELHS